MPLPRRDPWIRPRAGVACSVVPPFRSALAVGPADSAVFKWRALYTHIRREGDKPLRSLSLWPAAQSIVLAWHFSRREDLRSQTFRPPARLADRRCRRAD